MDKDYSKEDTFSIVELKAYLFDLISQETDKQQALKKNIDKEIDEAKKKSMQKTFDDNSIVLNNIIEKASELTLEMEKIIDFDYANSKDIATSRPVEKKDSINAHENKNDKLKEEEIIEKDSESDQEYPDVILKKETNDLPRGIMVSKSQFQKLKDSKIKQQKLVIEKNDETDEEEVIKPVISIDESYKKAEEKKKDTDKKIIDEKKDKENIIEEQKESKQEKVEEETKEEIKEENIEELLKKANDLYKEGNLKESEALYEKISSLNKSKVLTKAA